MFDDEDFELKEDDEEAFEGDTSSSFSNNQNGFQLGQDDPRKKSYTDKINSVKEKNNSISGTAGKPSANMANSSGHAMDAAKNGMNGGGINKAELAKNAAKALTSDDPEAIKALGKEGLAEAAVVGAQAVSSGAVGSDPVTRTVIKEGVKKLSETPPMDKLLDKLVPVAKAAKRSLIMNIVTSVLLILIPAFIILVIATIPMVVTDDVTGGAKSFFGSLGNWIIGNGWCATTEICNLEDAEEFADLIGAAEYVYSNTCGQYDMILDTEMITATIFYDQMVVGLGVNKGNLIPNDDESNYDYNNASSLYSTQLSKLYPNFFSHDNVTLLGMLSLEESTESDINNFINDYQNKINDKIQKIKDGENKEEREMTESEAKKYVCTPDYDAYKEYLEDNFIPTTALSVLRNDESKGYSEYTDLYIINDILSFAKHYEGVLNTPVSGGTITFGAGSAGIVPNEIIEASQSPLGNQPTGNSSCFGYYTSTNCTPHNGVDLTSPVVSPKIYSIADGVVKGIVASATHCTVDWKNGKACSYCANSAGNSVEVEHTVIINGVETKFTSQYFHLASISVRNGQVVSKGDEIGTMGNTGCSSGRHLHFNLLDASKKRYNPEELLQAYGVNLRSDCEEARRVCSMKGK